MEDSNEITFPPKATDESKMNDPNGNTHFAALTTTIAIKPNVFQDNSKRTAKIHKESFCNYNRFLAEAVMEVKDDKEYKIFLPDSSISEVDGRKVSIEIPEKEGPLSPLVQNLSLLVTIILRAIVILAITICFVVWLHIAIQQILTTNQFTVLVVGEGVIIPLLIAVLVSLGILYSKSDKFLQ